MWAIRDRTIPPPRQKRNDDGVCPATIVSAFWRLERFVNSRVPDRSGYPLPGSRIGTTQASSVTTKSESPVPSKHAGSPSSCQIVGDWHRTVIRFPRIWTRSGDEEAVPRRNRHIHARTDHRDGAP